MSPTKKPKHIMSEYLTKSANLIRILKPITKLNTGAKLSPSTNKSAKPNACVHESPATITAKW